MPTVHREKGFRIAINTHDHEPMHVHGVKGDGVVIINLATLTVRDVRRLKPAEVRDAMEIVAREKDNLIAPWQQIRPIP